MKYCSVIKRNKFESVLVRWMNLEPVIQTEVSQKEENKYHILTHIGNLEKWYWWTYLQGSSGDEDTENRLVDTVREGESGTNRESSIDIYTLWGIRQTKALVTQSYLTLRDPMDCSLPRSSVRGISQGKNAGVGSHSLLQGIFLTQGSRSPAWQADSLPSEPPGKPP